MPDLSAPSGDSDFYFVSAEDPETAVSTRLGVGEDPHPLHGAMAHYLTRYLNVPPARGPGEGGEQLDDLPTDPEAIDSALLDAFDRQRQVDQAARLVTRHFQLGHPPERLIVTLCLAVLREDAGFHAYQMLEAGVRQFAVWGDTDPQHERAARRSRIQIGAFGLGPTGKCRCRGRPDCADTVEKAVKYSV
jgi:hypothetical protein